jgi:hypothetical protein
MFFACSILARPPWVGAGERAGALIRASFVVVFETVLPSSLTVCPPSCMRSSTASLAPCLGPRMVVTHPMPSPWRSRSPRVKLAFPCIHLAPNYHRCGRKDGPHDRQVRQSGNDATNPRADPPDLQLFRRKDHQAARPRVPKKAPLHVQLQPQRGGPFPPLR